MNELKLLPSGGSCPAHELKKNSVVHRLVAPEMHDACRIFLEFDFQQILEVDILHKRFGDGNPAFSVEGYNDLRRI